MYFISTHLPCLHCIRHENEANVSEVCVVLPNIPVRRLQLPFFLFAQQLNVWKWKSIKINIPNRLGINATAVQLHHRTAASHKTATDSTLAA